MWYIKILLTHLNPLWRLSEQRESFLLGSSHTERWSEYTPTRTIRHNNVQYTWEFRL